MLKGFIPDLRPTLRGLMRAPGFAVFAILTLALGIGANTTIFTVADAFIFKPVPFPDAERLMMLHERAPGNTNFPAMVSPADFLDFRSRASSYEQVAAFVQVDLNLSGTGKPGTGDGDVEPIYASLVTSNFFDMLGMKAMIGRTFAAGEDQPGQNQIVVLSYGLWQQRFGGDPNIGGRKIKLNGSSYSVVGVMSKDFRFPVASTLWTPLALTPKDAAGRDDHWLRVIARLRSGVSESQARGELESISAALASSYPQSNHGWGVMVQPLRRYITGDFNHQYSLLLLGAVFFVLLIACANVMNLQFARMSGRQKEFAVRTALGASRWRIARQVILESTILSLAGALASLLLSAWSLDLILSTMPGEVAKYIAGWENIHLDGRALAFTFVIALFAGILAGLIPALRSTSILNEALKQSGRGTSSSRARQRIRSVLVIAEVGSAMVLLAGAGLLIKGSQSLLRVDAGLNPQSILSMQIVLTDKHYGESHQRAAFYDQMLERLATLPGVDGAALTSNVPYGFNERMATYGVEGQPSASASERRSAQLQAVSANYLAMAGIPLLQGRGFQDSDTAESTPVAVVTEKFARRNWPGEDAIGHRVRIGGATTASPWLTVIGVVKDVRYDPWASEIAPAIYQPYRQAPQYYTYIAIRAKGDPLAVAGPARRAIAALDIDRPVFEVQTLDRVITNKLIGLSYCAVMLAAMGMIAIVLSAVGIYSLMAYSVTERTQEIGIRLALGATRGDVFRMVGSRGVFLVTAGLAIGLAISIPLARLLSSMIYGVGANDPVTFGGTAGLLAVVALLACYFPVRRAMSTDPIVALRNE